MVPPGGTAIGSVSRPRQRIVARLWPRFVVPATSDHPWNKQPGGSEAPYATISLHKPARTSREKPAYSNAEKRGAFRTASSTAKPLQATHHIRNNMRISKFRTFLPTVLLAAAGIMVAVSPASAALTYNAGDLFLGFRTTTPGDGSVIINIGQASTYRDATGNFSLSVGNLDAELTARFGENWDTRSDLLVGVAGSPSNVVGINGDTEFLSYASKAQATIGTQSSAWGTVGSGTAAPIGEGARESLSTLMQGIDNAFLAGTDSTNLDNGAFQVGTQTNGWRQYMPGGANASGGIAFGLFNPTIEDSFNGGVSNVALDLYRIIYETGAGTEPGTGGVGQYQGTFTFTADGGINYSITPGAVPEPSRAVLVIAALGSFLFRRRRSAAL